jgi:hypothetical protein
MSESSAPSEPSATTAPPDKVSLRDVLLSLLIPVYGALAGLIAVSHGQRRRGGAMAMLCTINLLLLGQAIDLLR